MESKQRSKRFICAKTTKVKMVLRLNVWIEEVLDILGKTIVECFYGKIIWLESLKIWIEDNWVSLMDMLWWPMF